MINWRRVSDVRNEVGEVEFRPLVELFLDEIEAAIMATVPGDPGSLRHALQFMKGCALNIGLTAFCQTCDASEAMLLDGRGAELQIDQLMASYALSKQALIRDIDGMTVTRVESGAA